MMISIGSKKRWYTGSWILAALLLLGHNGFNLISLFNPSFGGRSVEVKLASEKWGQLKERTAFAAKNALDVDLDLILSRIIPGTQEQEKSVSRLQEDRGVGGKNTVDTKLPILAGIVGFSDVHGSKRLLAVIEGGAYAEKAQIQGYTIREITQKGIVLTKAGKDWHVKVPEVNFSVDRRMSPGQEPTGTIEIEGSSEHPE